MSLSNHLMVFNHVISKGKIHDNKYHLEGLTAWHDFDGYTCYLGYQDLVMTLQFHGRFSYEYKHRVVYNEFNTRVVAIARRLSRQEKTS